ncbi:MAG TPA: hypothetical protein VK780_07875 [Thermoanaerobaculia bacterium]|nr:hypothetical protein [Thermoanaerobaculia bacterium]
MGWTRCPHCGFTQVASEKCLRCAEPLPKPVARPSRTSGGTTAPPPRRAGRFTLTHIGLGAGALLLLAVALILVLRRSPSNSSGPAAVARLPSAASTLDLSGRWYGQVSDTLQGESSRPVLKEASIETDRDGNIVAAQALLTDPGRGGAGAGYRTATDGAQRITDAVAVLASSPGGAPVNVDFLVLAPWMPQRARLWRALEGINRKQPDVRYLLLESIEDDYVVQAGINRSGFLSYAFFSRPYAPTRGMDLLSGIVHPEPGSSLGDFRNLVWDLTGSADFLTLQVRATLAGPDAIPDRMVLKR